MTRIAVEDLFLLLRDDRALEVARRFSDLDADRWEAVIAEMLRLGFPLQVRAQLTRHPEWPVPAPCRDRVEAAVKRALLHGLHHQGSVRPLLQACARESLPVMVLKGLWLGACVYRNPGARIGSDIDLLVRVDDLPRFLNILRDLGLAVPDVDDDFRASIHGQSEFAVRDPLSGTLFDVHWGLTHPIYDKPVDETALWDRAEPVTIAGQGCVTLGVEDHLLYLCFHAALHHRFDHVGPRVLVDVAQLIRTPPRPIDWDRLVIQAGELGWRRAAWLVLDLTSEHLGVSVPPAVMDALRPDDLSDIARVRRAAVDAMLARTGFEERIGRSVVALADQRSMRGAVAMAARRVFPARHEIALRYGRNADMRTLPWLYVRWFADMVLRHGPKMMSLAAGDTDRSRELERMRILKRWAEG